MPTYYPAQILPLGVKLETLPSSSFERFPDVMSRVAICEEYTVSAVNQLQNDIEVVLSVEGKADIRLDYQFDQVAYVRL
jgi:hypothetical protein